MSFSADQHCLKRCMWWWTPSPDATTFNEDLSESLLQDKDGMHMTGEDHPSRNTYAVAQNDTETEDMIITLREQNAVVQNKLVMETARNATEREAASDLVCTLKRARDALKAENGMEHEKVELLEAKVAALEVQLEECKDEAGKGNEVGHKAVAAASHDAEGRVAELEAVLAGSRVEHSKVVELLEAKLAELEVQLEECRDEAQEAAQEAVAATRSDADAKIAVMECNMESTLSIHRMAHEQQMEQIELRVAELEEHLQGAQEEVEVAVARHQAVAAASRDAEGRLAELEAVLAGSRVEHSTVVELLKAQVAVLEKRLEGCWDEVVMAANHDAEGRVAELEAVLAGSRVEHSKVLELLEAKVAALEVELEERRDEAQEAAQEAVAAARSDGPPHSLTTATPALDIITCHRDFTLSTYPCYTYPYYTCYLHPCHYSRLYPNSRWSSQRPGTIGRGALRLILIDPC